MVNFRELRVINQSNASLLKPNPSRSSDQQQQQQQQQQQGDQQEQQSKGLEEDGVGKTMQEQFNKQEGKSSNKIVIRFNEVRATQEQPKTQHQKNSEQLLQQEQKQEQRGREEGRINSVAELKKVTAPLGATGGFLDWLLGSSSTKNPKEQKQQEQRQENIHQQQQAESHIPSSRDGNDHQQGEVADQEEEDLNSQSDLRKATTKKQVGRALTGKELDSVDLDLDWHKLPPSPIYGMQLTENGLYDSDVGRFMDTDELRDLINQTGKLEAATNMAADTRLEGSAINRFLELGFVSGRYICIGAIVFFWFIKLPTSYAAAFPRKSVLIKHYYQRWHKFDTMQVEAICQQRRGLLMATNPRCLAFSLFGLIAVGGFIVGEITRKWPNEFKSTSYLTTRQGQHYEGTMKWLFSVYYHHPAYSQQAGSRPSRSLQTSVPQNLALNKPTTPNLNTRRPALEQRIPNR